MAGWRWPWPRPGCVGTWLTAAQAHASQSATNVPVTRNIRGVGGWDGRHPLPMGRTPNTPTRLTNSAAPGRRCSRPLPGRDIDDYPLRPNRLRWATERVDAALCRSPVAPDRYVRMS